MKDYNDFNLDNSIDNNEKNEIKIKVKNNNLIQSNELRISSNLSSSNTININENEKNEFNYHQNLQIYSSRTTNALNSNKDNSIIESQILLNDTKNKKTNPNYFFLKILYFSKVKKCKFYYHL